MTSPSRRKILTAGGLGLLTVPLGGLAAPQAYGVAGRPATRAPAVALDVISDIQGGLADLGRQDWAARKIVQGGDPRGFHVFNTGMIETLYRPDGKGGEKALDPAASQGLRVLLDADGRLTVESHDFTRGTIIRSLQL
ncbi:DUF4073 domain-containing protein [Streptomyces albidoflavus]